MHTDVRSTLNRVGAYLVALLLVASLTPAAAFADQEATSILWNEHGYGYVPLDVPSHDEPVSPVKLTAQSEEEEEFPESYRSDEQPWAEGIRVKDQRRAGLCWVFATTTAAEYSYAKETYEQLGAVSEMSPAHLGYFLFNRVVDPLGNTAGDSNVCYCFGGWPLLGGNMWWPSQHLATYSGMALEETAPSATLWEHMVYDEEYGDEVYDGTYPLYDDSAAYDDYATLEEQNVFWLWSDAGVNNDLKWLVSEYGAVQVPIEMDQSRFLEEEIREDEDYEDGHSFYNYTDHRYANHVVTIIGWDDSYAASNFAHAHNIYGKPLTTEDEDGETVELTEEEALEVTTPPGDGAWIAQNSWGDGVHYDGCFYMSYYSADVNSDDGFEAYAYDMQPADTYKLNFQYDGTCGMFTIKNLGVSYTNAGTSAANVYTNTTGGPVTLDGVGFTLFSYDSYDLDVSVYTALEDGGDPTSGLLAGTTRVTTDSGGVKTAALDEPVTIGAGERFAVVFDFLDDETAFGMEKSAEQSDIAFIAQVDPGQSFLRAAGSDEWEDMCDYDACFRIKGLANPLDESEATYLVSFVDGWGNVVETQRVAHGQAAQAPEDPSRRGYRFAGWDGDFSEVRSNVLVRAIWEHAPEWDRLAGDDRYATMAAIVEAGFESSEWVVVATGASFPDALVAASLAGHRGCPVVLTRGTDQALGADAKERISRLGATSAYVVGGPGAVSEGIEAELESMGLSVTRVAGADRQSTSAAALAELAGTEPDTVVVATGQGFADALSIGPWCYAQGAPILLARDGLLSSEQVRAVRSVKSIESVVIVGGTAAVSDDVRIQLGRSYSYERLAGGDRYATSAAIAEWETDEWGMGLASVAVATGASFPDALAGAALCGSNGSPLLLVGPGKGGTAHALNVIDADPHSVEVGYVLGGTGSVPDSTMDQLVELTK